MDHHIDNQFGIDQTHFDNALKNIQLGIPYDNYLVSSTSIIKIPIKDVTKALICELIKLYNHQGWHIPCNILCYMCGIELSAADIKCRSEKMARIYKQCQSLSTHPISLIFFLIVYGRILSNFHSLGCPIKYFSNLL